MLAKQLWEREFYHALEVVSPPELLLHLHRQVSGVSFCCYLLLSRNGNAALLYLNGQPLFSSCEVRTVRLLPADWLHQELELGCAHAKTKGLLHTENNSPLEWTGGWRNHLSSLQLLPLQAVFTLPLLKDGRQAAGWKQWLVFSNWQHFNKYNC